MSVQLVVYPQWYNGIPSSGSSGEMLSNPTDFSAAGTGSPYATAGMPGNVMAAMNATMITNTWYGFFGAGAVATGPNAVTLQYPQSGIFQKVGGLTTGAVYDVTITFGTALAQPVRIDIYNGGTFVSQVVTVASGASNEGIVQFTAPSAGDTILVISTIGQTSASSAAYIIATSIKLASNGPSVGINHIGEGSVLCDLYEDEDIPLTLSVDNFKNAAESVQSYSKAFNLPGTKRNNQIFDNMFEITRDVDANSIHFNPLIKTRTTLKQDGILLFEGYLRMLDISEKDGEVSYNVNLYSEVVALVDALKNRTLGDLGFRELEHDYNKTNILNSWNDIGTGIVYTMPNASGFRNDNTTMKYPFVDWNHQIPVSDGIYVTAGNPELTKLEQAFRPWINVKYLVDRIFNAPLTPFTYTSSFFDLSLFENLYMDFNWGAEEDGASSDLIGTNDRRTNLSTTTNLPTNYSAVPYSVSLTSTGVSIWDNLLYRLISTVTNLEVTGSCTIMLEGTNTLDTRYVDMRLVKCDAFGIILETLAHARELLAVAPPLGTSGTSLSVNISTTLNSGEYLQAQAKMDNSDASARISKGTTSQFNVSYDNDASQVDTLLNRARADVNQWDFLKGIMAMFNLVTLPDPENINNVIIETYEEIFVTQPLNVFGPGGATLKERGIFYDWTDKVDGSTMKLEPLFDTKAKVVFKFVEDDDDYTFNVYKKGTEGYLYGSKVWFEDDLDLLSGEDKVVAEPFAATVIKPYMTQYPDLIVPSIYAMSDDGETEGFENAPRIMFNNGVKDSGTTYWIPAQNGVLGATETDYLQFSHFTNTPPGATNIDTNFGTCQLLPSNYTPISSDLFTLFWLPYFAELYNPNTRSVTLKVDLSPADINTFRFNYKVMIKNRSFRVNQINYKPNDFATVELILLP